MGRIAVVSCAVAAALVLTACAARRPDSPYLPLGDVTRDPIKAQTLSQEAAAVMDKNPAKAERLLRDAVTADLYYGPAHNNLGVAFLKQSKLGKGAREEGACHHCGIRYEAKTIARQIALQRVN